MMREVNQQNALRLLPFYRHLLFALLVNTLIAFIVAFLFSDTLLNALIFSHSIGLSIFAAVEVYAHFFSLRPLALAVPLLIGSLVGLTLAIVASASLQGIRLESIPLRLMETPRGLLVSLVLALGLGSLVLYFVINKIRTLAIQQALQREQMQRLASEKSLTEAQLRLLQAQVEPHFLFNTLSNIAALIEVAPQTSRQLLEELTHYLRAVLQHSRKQETTLADEIALLRHYLTLHHARIGERLRFDIRIPAELDHCIVPPMLVQPLVENAIKHGIEPSATGGDITIQVERLPGKIRLSVTDTGIGLQQSGGSGFGITNIRERLHSLYGDAAALEVRANTPHGVTAMLEIPDACR